ncbi:hypothetical protein ACGYY1_09100 [Burkholderia pseudomallei]|uniref:hypothetical protein n=2 Tax=Burkholderia pseudomallei TaxID=28450 RepID=UPI001E593C31|nr:hypothetical protein [Burkholderia pseudomallei]MCW0093027.1 hypothetical protein [Burkholderia pseudomallei]MDV2203414.1 hypothetical protein [Burkholderia pseudomallei]
MRQLLKLPDPRLPENEASWRRLIDRFLRPPTAEEMVSMARGNDPLEALATVSAFRNHLAAGTRAPGPITDFMLEALGKIVAGEDANIALGLKLRNRSRMPAFYRRKAAYYVLYQVASGLGVEEACETVAAHILAHKAQLRSREVGKGVARRVQPDMADEEVRIWAKEKVSKDLMMRCYREHKQEMLAVLKNDE